jgi:hypothetical protein
LNGLKQRKIDARAHRQECLHATGNIETVAQFPQPKNLIKNEEVKVEKKINTVVTGTIKRGRGRPPKAVSEKIDSKKKAAITGKSKPLVAKRKR